MYTPPHVYITMWEDLHNSAQAYTQRRRSYYSGCSVVLETLCVVVKDKLLCLGSKRGHVLEHFNTNIGACAAHFTQDCVLKLEEWPTMLIKDCFYKVKQFQLYKLLTHSL